MSLVSGSILVHFMGLRCRHRNSVVSAVFSTVAGTVLTCVNWD